jgi:host factor-I protein
MANDLQLQDKFFNDLMGKKTMVNIYLINGIKLTGVIVGHDKYTLLLSGKGVDQLVYKHAISTTMPAAS